MRVIIEYTKPRVCGKRIKVDLKVQGLSYRCNIQLNSCMYSPYFESWFLQLVFYLLSLASILIVFICNFYFVKLFIFFNYCLLNSIFHLLQSLFKKNDLYKYLLSYLYKYIILFFINSFLR